MLTTRTRTGVKAKDLYKDYTLKAMAKTNTHKAKDLKNVLKDSSRPRTNITDVMVSVSRSKFEVSSLGLDLLQMVSVSSLVISCLEALELRDLP